VRVFVQSHRIPVDTSGRPVMLPAQAVMQRVYVRTPAPPRLVPVHATSATPVAVQRARGTRAVSFYYLTLVHVLGTRLRSVVD
jgi:hypothetical protein